MDNARPGKIGILRRRRPPMALFVVGHGTTTVSAREPRPLPLPPGTVQLRPSSQFTAVIIQTAPVSGHYANRARGYCWRTNAAKWTWKFCDRFRLGRDKFLLRLFGGCCLLQNNNNINNDNNKHCYLGKSFGR